MRAVPSLKVQSDSPVYPKLFTPNLYTYMIPSHLMTCYFWNKLIMIQTSKKKAFDVSFGRSSSSKSERGGMSRPDKTIIYIYIDRVHIYIYVCVTFFLHTFLWWGGEVERGFEE